ncbi:DgyrCDS4616 [Dimorphilus gyrociliatus]|uniref:DgyrCDS4616 n=1 Tax=Dimorphilus gyrociliatus TaxID=2664684 RepID=A0A7I8VHJ4_9ANNE|nr:DgyrCDS4616 [Dimorphilus gyrociliatus]
MLVDKFPGIHVKHSFGSSQDTFEVFVNGNLIYSNVHKEQKGLPEIEEIIDIVEEEIRRLTVQSTGRRRSSACFIL